MGRLDAAGDTPATARIDLAHTPPLALGRLAIEPARRRVCRDDGAEEIIEPRVMLVLVALASAEGQIRSRDDLLAACWHGVVVGEDAINRVISRLRRLLADLGQGAFQIETIPRVGYRLVASGPDAATDPGRAGAPSPPPAGPSVVVRPFANLSGDPGEDYFAGGMVEEIVTALSRLRSILVVAGHRTPAAGGAEAGAAARYALEGSVRRAAQRVRITVRLIDLADQTQIWAERFEDELADIFALQDRVALAVAAVVEPRVQHTERRRAAARPTDSMGAYDLYLRALFLYRAAARESLIEARDLLDRAVRLDPHYGLALALGAMCRRDLVLSAWSQDPDTDRREAIDLAARAVRLGDDDAEVLAFAAATLGALEADAAGAVVLFERALALNPGSAAAWLSSGMMRLRLGEAERAAVQLETSLQLDPLSPLRGWQLLGLGAARFEQGRLAEAASPLEEAARLLPAGPALALLIACHVRQGQPREAREGLARWRGQQGGDIRDQLARLWNETQRALCAAALAEILDEA